MAFQQKNSGSNVDWITPKDILDDLGKFDFDPCANEHQPWPTADRMISKNDGDGLEIWKTLEDSPFVWLNPPYGNEMVPFLGMMAHNNNGIALIPARIETQAFHKYVWPCYSAIVVPKGRIAFYSPDGVRQHSPPMPTVFVGYGQAAEKRLETFAIKRDWVLLY